jgi:nicotinate (nicotinamide) nucleotide adenylyltransferase
MSKLFAAFGGGVAVGCALSACVYYFKKQNGAKSRKNPSLQRSNSEDSSVQIPLQIKITPPPSEAKSNGIESKSPIPESMLFPFNKLQQPIGTGKPLAVLISCGSFSPITFLHLSIFETARNYLMVEVAKLDVVGGIISPVHDKYGKSSLIPARHRVDMAKRATDCSDWVEVSEWEIHQSGWTRTAEVLRRYQQYLDEAKLFMEPVRVMLLCGTDLLESFLSPGVWSQADMDYILGTHGVACIERVGFNARQLVDNNEMFRKYKDQIYIVPQRISNTISSTQIRYNIQNNLSVKYLLPDPVLEYIREHKLYGMREEPKDKDKKRSASPEPSA